MNATSHDHDSFDQKYEIPITSPWTPLPRNALERLREATDAPVGKETRKRYREALAAVDDAVMYPEADVEEILFGIRDALAASVKKVEGESSD